MRNPCCPVLSTINHTTKIKSIVWLAAGLALGASLGYAAELPHETRPFENLMVAGQPSLRQLEALSQEGFTTVVNLRPTGEFDGYDEAAEVTRLEMNYIHIPVPDVESIRESDAIALHEAISNAPGPVLLHCTVGWRAGGLLAIERYLLHGASREAALDLAAAAHMHHARDDVAAWIGNNE